MKQENVFVIGLLTGIAIVLLGVLAIGAVDRTGIEYRARAAVMEADMEPLTCKAVKQGRAAILTVEDGQLVLYYEDSAAAESGRLYSVRPK